MVEKIDKKSLEWRGNAPVSTRFDDVYYSQENGLEETEFVFLQGIDAPTCWSESDKFVIAETGFGTGLNFLATYRAWKNSGAKGKLTYISVEKYPLTEDALAEAHQTFPELAAFSKELCAAWPPPAPGFHTRSFAGGQIQLLLLFGEASEAFADLHGAVDAWYLDGFAPAKNPEMWTEALFDQIHRLSKQETKFATFTAAGFVKRALKERGFQVEKTPGYGRKRERLIGQMTEPGTYTAPKNNRMPEWASVPTPRPDGTTLIIGAGIAGSCLARLLQDQGTDVLLLSDGAPAGSDVPTAILSPGFQRSLQPAAQFATSCFAHACCYSGYEGSWAEEAGVLLTSEDPAERSRLLEIADLYNWGDSWIEKKEKGLFLPKSGSLSPTSVLQKLQDGIKHTVGHVQALNKQNNKWIVRLESSTLTADNLVIAGGMNSDLILGNDQCLDLRPKPGQIEITAPDTANLPTGSHAYGGYVTAATDQRTIGSTFDVSPETGREWPVATNENTTANLKSLQEATGAAPTPDEIVDSWAGVRATTPDYLPYVGPVPDWQKAAEQYKLLAKDRKIRGLGDMPYQQGLYLLTGFGAKGFQQAPLCAAYIAAMILGTPLPLPKSIIPYLHPARHMIKSIVRSKHP